MENKKYIKPEIIMVGLRTEERLAYCGDWYESSFNYGGCNKYQHQNTEPDTCYRVKEIGVS